MKSAKIGKLYKGKGYNIKIINPRKAIIKKGKVEMKVPSDYVTKKRYANKIFSILKLIPK